MARVQELRRSNAATAIPARSADDLCDCGGRFGDGTNHTRCWMIDLEGEL